MSLWHPLPPGSGDGDGKDGLSCARAQSFEYFYSQVERGFSTASLASDTWRALQWGTQQPL
jgi:hypothetical protein